MVQDPGGVRRGVEEGAHLGSQGGDLVEGLSVLGDGQVDPVVGQGVLVVELVLGGVGPREPSFLTRKRLTT